MSEQARKVKNDAIPHWAEGLFSEVLLYHDEEALYFECRGKDSGVVRFSFEMLETLKRAAQEIEEERPESLGQHNGQA